MMRVLFTCQPSSGHWHPLVPLARTLQAAGHEVAFASTEGFGPSIEAKGFRCFRAGIDDSEEELALRRAQQAKRTLKERADFMQSKVFAGVRAERSLADMVDLVREWRPSLVVRENTEYCGCVAAEGAGIPHAAVQITALRTNFLQVIDEPLRHLCSLVGVTSGKPADMLYRYLLLSPRPMSLWNPEFPVPSTMRAFRYEGYNHSGDEGLPQWVEDLGERPTVYATLGTVHNFSTDILSAILTGVRQEPVNLILTVGRNRDPREFGEQPPHVHVERYIPQSLLLPRCDLVVTHGGTGTMLDALGHGLPMVMIPLGADQPENAGLCARAGVARVISPEQSAGLPEHELAQVIGEAVRDVLGDRRYRENAQRLRGEMEALPRLEQIIPLLEGLVAAAWQETRVEPRRKQAQSEGSGDS